MQFKYPKAVRVNGTLRCPTCDKVLKPRHNHKNCCKSAYRQHMDEYKKEKDDE